MMYGNNLIHKQDLSQPDALRVKEVFYTIQGEGPHAGHVAVFIRLGGCNLRCHFCDTDFETNCVTYSQQELLAEVQRYIQTGLIVLTGGEPMRQNIAPLCNLLISNGYTIQIETAGTVWVPDLPQEVEIVCSPKTAKVHPQIAARCRVWKYLIRSGEVSATDSLPEKSTQRRGMTVHIYRASAGVIYVQPIDEGPGKQLETNANTHEAVQACLRHGYRLSLQLHKLAGVP
jgi:organic radical activating enzyme